MSFASFVKEKFPLPSNTLKKSISQGDFKENELIFYMLNNTIIVQGLFKYYEEDPYSKKRKVYALWEKSNKSYSFGYMYENECFRIREIKSSIDIVEF